MGLYAEHVFPRLMDWGMRGVGPLRDAALAGAHGEVLEVGFGTGLNLAHYSGAVERLVALDPLRALRERVDARIAAAPFPVERVPLPAGGRLPFEDASFDCVVTTWTLCSIDDAEGALREMRRVLRPSGRYLFIEHGESEDLRTRRWQRRQGPLHQRIACGCRLDRRIDALVAQAGFEIRKLDRFVHESGPRIFAEMFRGEAGVGAGG
jgi:ubiquinone/menaquinone biosynthesis C-methylase UbiE